MTALTLPTVTLCAVASVNIRATLAALSESLEKARFADCLFFTHQDIVPADERIRVIPIRRLRSSKAYSEFMLCELVEHIKSAHCLVVQWDGFVLDAAQWDPGFLQYDYIGAFWPQFDDGHDVGNGGFSLRSRRLLEACLDPRFQVIHPEDVAICRVNRSFLEHEYEMVFAGRATAKHFSFERSVPASPTFGFHGIFNLIQTLGPDRFWEIYELLDDRSTAYVDYWTLVRQLRCGEGAFARQARLTVDFVKELLR